LADINKDCYITEKEIRLAGGDMKVTDPQGIDYKIFIAADVNGDKKLSYYELKAYYMRINNVAPVNATEEEDGCPEFL
jgi:hypothetical protein